MLYSGGGGGVNSGATSRAVMGMSIGAIKSWQERRERVWSEGLDEYDQQFQAPFTIETTDAGTWITKLPILFNLCFINDPTARDSDYQTPIFTYGIEMTGGDPLFMTVMVTEWIRSVQGVTGAYCAVGGHNPGSGKLVKCTGIIHFNFQGYGGPISDETQDSE